MIGFLPRIYPDESVHSYLCRIYVHSGYVWHIGFANEIFARGHEVPEYNFINAFTEPFRKTLEDYIPFETLLLKHTLFPYYARFLPKERRSQAYEYAMSNKPYLHKYLSIPTKKREHYLRYCPECVKADRALYGECYFHISHQIPSVPICAIHACELADTPIPNTKIKNTILTPLEQLIPADGENRVAEYSPDNIRVKVAKYIYDTLRQPFLLEPEIPIGDFLTAKLQDRYLSPRGEQRHLSELCRDMSVYYRNLTDYDISKARLATVFRNLSFHAYDILLVAMFEGIAPQELCAYQGYAKPRHIAFDSKVRALRAEGKSYQEIGSIMNICHEAVRKILSGAYEREKNSRPYRSVKWDWERIDQKCCREFSEKVLGIAPGRVSRRTVAESFGLKDKSLRNLPCLKKLIKNYKNSLN